VFVCDICNVFEGSFMVVAKHEKTCKAIQVEKPARVEERADAVAAPARDKKKRTFGRTAKEKREAAKKRKRVALGIETADERLDDVELAHPKKFTDGEERAAPPAAGSQEAVSAAPTSSGPPSKAERRKAAKKRKKEAARRAAGDDDAGDAEVGGAKRARLAPTEGATPREVRLAKGVRIVELDAGSGPVVQDRKRVKVSYIT